MNEIEKTQSQIAKLKVQSEDAPNQRAFDAIKVQIARLKATLDFLHAKERGIERAEKIKAERLKEKELQRIESLTVDYRRKLNILNADWQKHVTRTVKLCERTETLHKDVVHDMSSDKNDFCLNFRPEYIYEHLAAVYGTSSEIPAEFIKGIRRSEVPMVQKPLKMSDYNLKESCHEN